MSKLDKYRKRFEDGENPTEIMNDMECEFNIPCLNDEEYNKQNSDVIELYRKVANSRIW